MLTAIIVYLIIGAITVLLLRNVFADVVKNENLAIKVIYYIARIVVALPGIRCWIGNGVYQALKNESKS